MSKVTIKNLRRAESEIDNELAHVKRNANRSGYDFNNATAALNAGNQMMNTFRERVNVLVRVKYEIRDIVARFNMVNGINERTAQIAMLEAVLSCNEEECQSFGSPRSNRDYQTHEVTWTAGIELGTIDELRSDARGIKRKIQSLKDSCNGINSSKEVGDLATDEIIEFLKSNNFID